MDKRKLMVSILAGLLAASMLLGLIVSILPASAASSSEIEKQIEELEKKYDDWQGELDDLNQQVSDNMSEMEVLVSKKNYIDREISILHQQMAILNDQISAYALLIADKQDELDAANAHLAALREKNRERVRAMEEDGSLSYWSVLFKASSFSDLLDRLSMVEEIAAADSRRLKEMDAAAKEVAAARQSLETEKDKLLDKKAELSDLQADLDGKRAETDDLLAQLHARGEEYQRYIDAKEQDMADLSAELAQKQNDLEEAKRKEYEEWLSTSETTQPPTRPTTPSESAPPPEITDGISWTVPVRYILISSPYGMRQHPIFGTWMMHTGVDLAAPAGRDIWATRSGVVTFAGWSDGYGNYVIVNHGDGFSSLYAHMTHFVVETGQFVAAGQKIGEVGSTGNSTGPHLHFEIQYNGSTVNPVEYVNLR